MCFDDGSDDYIAEAMANMDNDVFINILEKEGYIVLDPGKEEDLNKMCSILLENGYVAYKF
jgi:hypothetical protein